MIHALALSLWLAATFAQPQEVTITYYAEPYIGRLTANGEIYTGQAMTCATNDYPLASVLVVCADVEQTWNKQGIDREQRGINPLSSPRCVVVRVNDRMRKDIEKHVDLSPLAFGQLALLSKGVVEGKVWRLR